MGPVCKPGAARCKNGIYFEAGWKNRIKHLSPDRMCLLWETSFCESPFSLAVEEEGFLGGGVAVVSAMVWRERSHLAHGSQAGSALCLLACSWLQLAARSLETDCSPQGGLGEWCRVAHGLPAKCGSGGRGLTL